MAEKIEFDIKVTKDELNEALLNGAASAKGLTKSLDDISKKNPFAPLSKSALEMSSLLKTDNSLLASLNKTLTNTSSKALDSSKKIDSLTDEINLVAYESKKTKEALAVLGQETGKVGGLFGKLGEEFKKAGSSFIGNIGANVVSSVFNSLKYAIGSTVDEARTFSRAIAEINSTLPRTSKLTKDQELSLARLSEQFGTSPTEQARGFFEVVSNGVEDAATAFDVLKNANNAALSGLVDVNTATQVITTTFNAYKAQGVSVAEVTDTLVAVTQASGAKFEELSSSMGRVTNVAAQSGVSIGELGGTIAFLNARSLTTEQAITGLAGALNSISSVKAGSDAANTAARLGIEFSAAAIKSKGLAGVLEDISIKTKGNIKDLRSLFPEQRAANAVIAIATSKFDEYRAVVDKVTASQGEASRAAGIIKESFDFEVDQLTNSFNELAISLGQKLAPLLPFLTGSVKAFASVFKTFSADSPIDALNTKLEKTNAIIEQLQSGSKAGLAKLGIDASVLSNEKLNLLLQEQIAIRDSVNQKIKESSQIEASSAAASPLVDTTLDQSVIDARRESFNQLAIARTEFDAFNAQLDADSKALSFETRQEELDALIEFEVAKIDASLQAEIEKTKLIQDEKARRDALDTIEFKKATQVRKLDAKRDLDGKKAQLALEQTFQNQKNAIISSSFGLASALAKDGSKTQFFIQKAAALAEIALARGKAIGLIPAQTALIPYPASLAASAQLLANANIQAGIGAATVAATAIKGFANGGVVGGATSGPDDQVATVRTGELILNAQQQKSLFDAINGGNLGGGGDVVVQIDGREIARATRNQIRSGFILA